MGVSFKPVGVTERKLDRETENTLGDEIRWDHKWPSGEGIRPHGAERPVSTGSGPLTATRHRSSGALGASAPQPRPPDRLVWVSRAAGQAGLATRDINHWALFHGHGFMPQETHQWLGLASPRACSNSMLSYEGLVWFNAGFVGKWPEFLSGLGRWDVVS